MFVFFTHSTQHSDEVSACFHCPACGERDVSGVAWTACHFTNLLGIVPVLQERLHWVCGPCCQRKLMSRVAPQALAELDADAIEAQGILFDRVSPVKIALLIGAFLFCVVPVVGPSFFLLAWLPNGCTRTWFRVACRVWLALHLVAMNAVLSIAIRGR